MLEGILPEGSKVDIKKDRNPYLQDVENVSFDAFDIVLPQGSMMNGAAEIELPFDKKLVPQGMAPEEVLSAAYFNEQENMWEPVPYIINADRGTVTILTDHFSRYAVVYFKDGRKKLSERLPEFDVLPADFYSASDFGKIVEELGSGSDSLPTALTAGWNRFGTYYGLTDAVGTILGEAVDSKTLNNVNNLMTEVGAGFAFAQLALDIYSGDNKAAVNNFIKNASAYSASKWGGSAVNLASAGVTFMDVAINKFAEKALDKNLQKWEDAYRKYYNTNMRVRRSAVDWYNVVKKLHAESVGPEDFKSKLDAEITAYCDLFWKDAEGYAHVAESTPGLRGFGAGGEYALGVSEISKRYKQFIYGTTMKPVMEVLMKNLCLQEYRNARLKYNRLKAELNKVYTVTVNLDNYKKVKDLKGTMVRFVNANGQVIHSQSFDGSGRAELSMTLFGFLKAGSPLKAEVKVPAQGDTPEYRSVLPFKLAGEGVALKAAYAPADKPAENKEDKKDGPVEKPQVQKPAQQDGSKPAANTKEPVAQTPEIEAPKKEQPKTEAPKPEYDYNAALAAWAADYAKNNNKIYEEEMSTTVYEFEWVMTPVIKNDQVIGAHRVWRTDTYHDGPRKGEKKRWVEVTYYDADNPGPYISVGELKKKYPQFSR